MTEETPNPSSLKFVPNGQPVLDDGTFEFDARSAFKSPLARKLFTLSNIKGVFLTKSYITITKQDDAAWGALKPSIYQTIMEFYASGQPILDENARDTSGIKEDDNEVIASIKELLDTKIRPMVQEDGGDVMFHRLTQDGILYLTLQGACSSCPSSTATLKGGIENMITHYIPEVVEIRPSEEDPESESFKMMQKVECSH
jgi:Fe-S cluster biogenesis protein NfuA